MKFTSKQLIEAMGLKEEDVILCQDKEYIIKENELVSKDERDGIGWEIILGIDYLLDKDFEIVKPKKKVGEQFCGAIYCNKCPLVRCCIETEQCTLYENLEGWNKEYNDKKIYDILKSRLDKEVK